MIAGRFDEKLAVCPDRPFLLGPAGTITYSGFYQRCRGLAATLASMPQQRLGCYMTDSAELIQLMLATGMSGKSLLVLNRDFDPGQLPALVERYGVDTVISDAAPAGLPCACHSIGTLDATQENHPVPGGADGEILILTSGTTGEPKCARYAWPDLFAQVSDRPAQDSERWLLAYRLNHFAGLQMLVHALHNGAGLVLPESSRVSHALEAMSGFGVTHVSSTPTFWRFALASLPREGHGLALEHITLGSEAVSGDLLDMLHEVFPDTRIVHIYASTEAGSCVSVSDLRPGLPIRILQRGENADVQFRIVEDELQIRSRHGTLGYAGAGERLNRDANGWLATGDLVRIEGDRIFFMGRRSETINVGGVKVHPLEVENVISPLAGVKLCRVYGQDNPVVGQIVAVDIVRSEDGAEAEVEEAVRDACQVLGRHARPRSINFVDTMETSNLKLKRE